MVRIRISGGAFIVVFERYLAHHCSNLSYQWVPPAWAGFRISREPFGLAGARPHLAAALAGCLPANFNACAAQLVLQPGGDGCSTSVLTDTL